MKWKFRLSILFFTSALALFVLANGQQSFAAGNKTSYPNNFSLLSHNVYMMSNTLYPNWGQSTRTDLIANADYVKGYDVVILNELFANEPSNNLLKKLQNQYTYQTPVLGRSTDSWDATKGSYSYTVVEDGGVAVLSKWPIIEQVQYVYKDACGMEANSNKGFVYTKIKKDGNFYHVIGTHMQSTASLCTNGEAAAVRAKQMKELNAFIMEKQIPKDEVIYIGGDLNVMKNSNEYSTMTDLLNVNKPTEYTGHTSTWDPTTNSIANYNYPDLAGQYLDYIFVKKNRATPDNWYIDSKKVKSPTWSVQSWGQTYTYDDYSDHYPVSGSPTK